MTGPRVVIRSIRRLNKRSIHAGMPTLHTSISARNFMTPSNIHRAISPETVSYNLVTNYCFSKRFADYGTSWLYWILTYCSLISMCRTFLGFYIGLIINKFIISIIVKFKKECFVRQNKYTTFTYVLLSRIYYPNHMEESSWKSVAFWSIEKIKRQSELN